VRKVRITRALPQVHNETEQIGNARE
jgi:hypothetical protein